MKRFFACVLIVALSLVPCFGASAENTDASLMAGAPTETVTYFDYAENLGSDAEEDIIVFTGDIKLSAGDSKQFAFEAEQQAAYVMQIEYNSAESLDELEIGLKINGEYLFGEMASIRLPRIWENSGEPRVDDLGNESAPSQKLWNGFSKQYISDKEGIALEPYKFEILKGANIIEIELLSGSADVRSISLVKPAKLLSYEAYIKNNSAKAYSGKELVIEGEDAVYKTDKTLISKADNSDPSLSPASAAKTLLNTIGFNSWNVSGEALSWVVEVPESAYYKLGFKFKQSEAVNNTSYRRLLIDGETPFEEAKKISFAYGNGWQYTELSGAKGEPYLVYLEKGKHTVTLEVTLGEVADFYRRLETIVNELGDIYINISMITGESPDKNRDYDLFRQIPDLTEKLKKNYDGLNSLANEMNASTDMSGSSMIAAMKNMARVLGSMIENPYTAQRYLSDYYSNYTSVGGWLYDMKSMPLSLDKMVLSAPDAECDGGRVGIFGRIFFGIKRFIYSFSSDYNTLGSQAKEGPTIKIWVNWGRDQAEILGNMIADDFTPESGINVKLEIVNAGIIKGILAGDPPDLSLHMARSEPVNLAMRGALVDLTDFKDYKEVSTRFAKTATVPYEYGGGVYALPDTQAFYVMYYRSDILEKLGVEVPTTWDEFINATVTIQRNNMQVWLPYLKITTATTVNTGVGGLSLFPTLMHQSGLSMYTEDQTAVTLGTTETLEVFEFWTDFYTQYKLPKEASFYNRFRIGTMPLGIESYTLYQTLVNAAPEIRENWSITEIPGIPAADGTVNNSSAGSGTGCGIIADTGNEKYAWEFIKWWTSAETQLKYSDKVETVLGTLGRVASANIEAVSGMSWKRDDLEVILSAWQKVEEVAEVPGSYYLTRAVDQAYWAVVNGTYSSREALMTWSKVADNEIERKISEYGKEGK